MAMKIRATNTPPTECAVVTKSDATVYTDNPFRALNPDTAGIIKVDMLDGGTNISIFVAAGGVYSGYFTKIYSTGTTVTTITGFR